MSSRSSLYRPPTIYRRGGGFNLQPVQQYPPANDNFPILEFREISICLQECGFIANEELVSKPTGRYVRQLFEQILEIFTGVTQENLTKTIEQSESESQSLSQNGHGKRLSGGRADNPREGEDTNGGTDSGTTTTSDDTLKSLSVILFYKLAYSFLNDCGFYDLSLLDIIRPEPYRMKRILSAIVNYAKFREEHSIDYEKYNEDCEGHFQKLNHAEMENVEFKNRIVDLKRKLEENESPEVIEGGGDGNGRKKATLKQTKAYNTKLEMELVKLKRIQDELNTERSKYRNEKLRLSEKIEDNEYLITEAKEKLLGLQNYLKTDLSLHKKVIEELNVDLSELQETVKTLTNQNRNLSVTIESFKVVENELKQLFKNLEEISKDLHNEEQSFSKLSEYNEIMDSYQLEATDLKNKIELVNTQIEAQKAKKERSDKKLAVKKSQEELKILELNEEYHKLLKEKQNFEETYNDRNNKISILENKIKLIRKDFDQEFKETERYMEKLNAHVRKYIQEMSVAMGGTDIRER